MNSIDFQAYFTAQNPDFFERAYLKNLPEDAVYEEMALDLRAFQPEKVSLPVPDGASFGWYQGEEAPLLDAVNAVDPSWAQYYRGETKNVYTAVLDGRIVSFCLIEPMGEYGGLRFGGPGCVGTVPAFRKRGIGLYMVKNATEILKEQGYGISYIHYTGVAPWYARLGYETVLRWNRNGFIDH